MKRISDKQKEKLKKKKEENIEMKNTFLALWDMQKQLHGKVTCFETGVYLPLSFRENSCCYHHILKKEIYPEFRNKEWNIVILHPDVHTLTHDDMDKTPKIKKRYEELLKFINQEVL